MTTKEKLYQYLNEKRKIAEVEEKLMHRLDTDAERIRSIKSSLILPAIAADGMPHAHYPSDRIAEGIAQIEEIVNRSHAQFNNLKRMRDNADRIKEETEYKIQRVENGTYRMLLFYRFIRGLNWWKVTEALERFENRDYSEGYIRNILQTKALNAFEKANER